MSPGILLILPFPFFLTVQLGFVDFGQNFFNVFRLITNFYICLIIQQKITIPAAFNVNM